MNNNPQSKTLHLPSNTLSLPPKWVWSRLDDICLFIVDCPHSTPKITNYGPLVVRTQDVLSGIFRTKNAAHVSEETYTKRTKRAEPTYGDLLYSREGTYFGIAAEVPLNTRVCLGQRMVLIRPDFNQVNFRFLRYWLNSSLLTSYIYGHRDGSVAERLNLPTIRALPIPLPSLPEQQAIAHILGSLDDKIELNRQMNETLEDMARALFKSWFVDFDPVRAKMEGRQPYGMDAETAELFPDGFEDSSLERTPKGWRIAKFTDVILLSKKSIEPSQHLDEIFDHYSIPAFDTERLPIFEKGRQIKSNKFLVPKNAVLLSKINPTIPRAWFPSIGETKSRSICSTEFLVLLAREETISAEYLYTLFSTNNFQERFVALANGTSNSHQRVQPDTLLNMDFLIPDRKLIEHFTDTTRSLYKILNLNLNESQTLSTLRDTLLPKLLSGEIRVREAEKDVGGVL